MRKDVVPMLHCWHGGRSSCRGDGMCGLEKAALQKSVLSGTRALLEGSNQLWSRQGAILTEGVAKMPGSYAASVFWEFDFQSAVFKWLFILIFYIFV